MHDAERSLTIPLLSFSGEISGLQGQVLPGSPLIFNDLRTVHRTSVSGSVADTVAALCLFRRDCNARTAPGAPEPRPRLQSRGSRSRASSVLLVPTCEITTPLLSRSWNPLITPEK